MATSLRWLRLLLDHGVEVHGQVVVCPGMNDKAALEDTFLGVLDRFPELASVGVVPLGVSGHNTEPDMRTHAPGEAAAVMDVIDRWQATFVDVLGRRMVFAADEYYLMAGRPFPDAEEYEGFPQHENGIGMARTFFAEVEAAPWPGVGRAGGGSARGGFFQWVDGAPADGYRSPHGAAARSGPVARRTAREVALLTGEYGARVLEPVLPALAEAAGRRAGVPVPNRLFGGNIAVTGLLAGADVAACWRGAAGRCALPPARRHPVPGRVPRRLGPADLPRPSRSSAPAATPWWRPLAVTTKTARRQSVGASSGGPTWARARW